MKKDEIAARNLLIGAEFDKFIIEHPEFLDQIPDGAQLVFLPEYDQELCEENLKLIKSLGIKTGLELNSGKPELLLKKLE